MAQQYHYTIGISEHVTQNPVKFRFILYFIYALISMIDEISMIDFLLLLDLYYVLYIVS